MQPHDSETVDVIYYLKVTSFISSNSLNWKMIHNLVSHTVFQLWVSKLWLEKRGITRWASFIAQPFDTDFCLVGSVTRENIFLWVITSYQTWDKTETKNWFIGINTWNWSQQRINNVERLTLMCFMCLFWFLFSWNCHQLSLSSSYYNKDW